MIDLLVLHQGALGDFLLSLSVIQSARVALRADHVSAIASAPSARLAAGRSAIDACLSPDAVALHTLFADSAPDPRLSAALADADMILNFLSAPTDPLHARLQQLSRGRLISIDPRPTASTLSARQHITSQWTAAIRAQNLDLPDPTPARLAPSAKRGVIPPMCPPSSTTPKPACVSLPSSDLRNPDHPRNLRSAFSPDASRPPQTSHLLIHPGSGGQAKCWPLDRFLALSTALVPAQIHWLLGPAEQLSPPSQGSTKILSPPYQGGTKQLSPPYQGGAGGGAAATNPRFAALPAHCSTHHQPIHLEHDLESAAALISTMNLYIGNDAGATHLAAALGIPTLAIFGPTDPAVWRPLGDHVHVVAPPAPASIDTVPLEAVLATARDIISA